MIQPAMHITTSPITGGELTPFLALAGRHQILVNRFISRQPPRANVTIITADPTGSSCFYPGHTIPHFALHAGAVSIRIVPVTAPLSTALALPKAPPWQSRNLRVRFPGSAIAARDLGVHRAHLHRVLTGERTSADLLARWKAWLKHHPEFARLQQPARRPR